MVRIAEKYKRGRFIYYRILYLLWEMQSKGEKAKKKLSALAMVGPAGNFISSSCFLIYLSHIPVVSFLIKLQASSLMQLYQKRDSGAGVFL